MNGTIGDKRGHPFPVTEIDGKSWLYLFYATQRGGNPYDYRYDRIRAMRRPLK